MLVEPFKISENDYKFWVENTPLEIFFDFNKKNKSIDTQINQDSEYTFIESYNFYIKAKKFAELKNTIVKGKNSFTFSYSYHQTPSVSFTIGLNKIIINSDYTSLFPIWFAYSEGKLAITQTYGDLLRLCIKENIKLKQKNNIKNYSEIFYENDLFDNIHFLEPDFIAIIDKESQKTIRKETNLDFNVQDDLEEIIDDIVYDFELITKYFDKKNKKIATALSGGKDSAIITALTQKTYSQTQLQTYTLVTPEPNLLNYIKSVTENLTLENFTIDLTPQGLALVDPYDIFLNPYNKANLDLAQMVAKNNKIYFNGFGGDEIFKAQNNEQNPKLENEENENLKKFINFSFLPHSIVAAHNATSPFYYRCGVIPFSPFAIRNYCLKILLIDDKFKLSNFLYEKIFEKLHLPKNIVINKRFYKLRSFFEAEFNKSVNHEHENKDLGISHSSYLQKLSLLSYNNRYGYN